MAEIRQSDTDWRLDWRELPPRERWAWWNRLWTAAIDLRGRYRLSLRASWWKDDIQVETLAALAAWVSAHDIGAWRDPPSKLQLLYDLDRIRALLQAGQNVFDPDRERKAFDDHLDAIGCQHGEPS